MSREGQHVSRLAVKGDTKSGVTELDKLKHAQAQGEAQTAKNNLALAKFAAAQDAAAAATKRAQEAQQQQVEAAKRAGAQLAADSARRQREALQASGQKGARAQIEAIEREKTARLRALELERRAATTQADRIRVDNRADQVRHEARLQRLRVEQAAENEAAKAAQRRVAQAAAAAQASAQLHVDAAKRGREVLEQNGAITQKNLKAHIAAIEREKTARLSQIDLERRTARTSADSLRLANQADQVRHEAFMRRRDAERAAQQQASTGAQVGGFAKFAAGAGAAAIAADQLAQRSMQLANVQANLPFSIEKARAATKGLVSDYDLMRQAIAANRLGVAKTGEDFAKVAEISTKLGVSMGQDATQSLDNLVNGLGRASTEVLDNLGITMRAEDAYKIYAARLGKSKLELTDLEKRQAVVTIGLERGAAAASKVTLEVDGMAGAWAKAKVEIVNAADALINFDDSARDLAREGLLALGATGEQATRATAGLGDAIKTGFLDAFTGGAYSALSAGIDGIDQFGGEVQELATITERGQPQWTFLTHFLRQQGDLAQKAAGAWQDYVAVAGELTADEEHRRRLAQRDLQDLENVHRHEQQLAIRKAAAEEEKKDAKAREERSKRAAAAQKVMIEGHRAALQLNIAGSQRELQAAEERNAAIGERLALIDSVAAAERELAEKEYQWATERADQLRAVGALEQSQHAQAMARRQAILELEQRARAEHNARVQAEGETGLASLRRSHELQAANTGLSQARLLGLMEPERAAGAEASFGLARLQEQAKANNELREAERALLEQRLAGTTDYAERLRIQDEIAQLAHEAELERISVISAVEQKQLDEARARAEQRKAIAQSVMQSALGAGQSAVMAGIGIARAEKAAAKAAREAGESEAAARAKARGEGLISFGQQLQGEAVGHGAQSIAAFVTGNPIAGAGHAAAAIALAGAGSILVARGSALAARGGGASGGGTASFGGGGSSAATGSSFREGAGAGSPIPPSPQPGSLPSRVPQPGNPMGGTASPPARMQRGGGTVIHITNNAVTFDRGAVRLMRDEIDRLAATGG